MGVRLTPQVEDQEDCLEEDREAIRTGPLTACVSECFSDTRVQPDRIETNCAVTSPKTSLTDGQPSIVSSEDWKSWRRSPKSSRRKQPSPMKDGSTHWCGW